MLDKEASQFAQTKPEFGSIENESSNDELEECLQLHKKQSEPYSLVYGTDTEIGQKYRNGCRSEHSRYKMVGAEKAAAAIIKEKPFIALNLKELHRFYQTVDPILKTGPAQWDLYFQYCWIHRIRIEYDFKANTKLFEKCKKYIQSLHANDHQYVRFWITDTVLNNAELFKYHLTIGLMVRTYITCFQTFSMARSFSEDAGKFLQTDDGILENLLDLRVWGLIENLDMLISVLKCKKMSVSQLEIIEKVGRLFVKACGELQKD